MKLLTFSPVTRHVNNVRYRAYLPDFSITLLPHLHTLPVRFIESGRIRWISSVGEELGGPAQADAFVRGRGVSFILKSIQIDFRRPVQYPDTVSCDILRRSLELANIRLAFDRP
jgi:acyl-CoA thioesterase FadM